MELQAPIDPFVIATASCDTGADEAQCPGPELEWVGSCEFAGTVHVGRLANYRVRLCDRSTVRVSDAMLDEADGNMRDVVRHEPKDDEALVEINASMINRTDCASKCPKGSLCN